MLNSSMLRKNLTYHCYHLRKTCVQKQPSVTTTTQVDALTSSTPASLSITSVIEQVPLSTSQADRLFAPQKNKPIEKDKSISKDDANNSMLRLTWR